MGRRAIAVHLRMAARRPASWLAVAVVAFASWRLTAADGAAPLPAAILCGAIGAAVALGGLPRDGCAAWAASRAVWPVAGAVIGWSARGFAAAAAGALVPLLLAGGATVALVAAATRAGAGPAAAMGIGLAPAVAAATGAAAAALVSPAWAELAGPLAAVAWTGAAAAAPLCRIPAVGAALAGESYGVVVPRAVMLSALVAMVACLFLAPHLAGGYLAFAAGWLLVSAVPRAALGPGPDGDAARRILLTAAGPRARPDRAAARLVVAYAAFLGWPPLVAALLAGSTGAAAERLAIAAAIASGAAAIAATGAAALACGGSRDTALAAALSAAALVAAFPTASSWAVPQDHRGAGLMLSNPGDPATLPGPREEPRPRQSPRGVASCPAPPSSAPLPRALPRRPSCSS